MSLESVKNHLAKFNLADEIIYLDASSATVLEAANQLGIMPCEVAKTLAFLVRDQVNVIVVAGDCKIDNAKYKACFKSKAKMLSFDETLELTTHPVGGVCPFGLPENVNVYLDESLKMFEHVYPATGDRQAAIKVRVDQLPTICAPIEWIDVCKKIES